MTAAKTHKLYCYIDETGQDTLGRLFVVAIVMTDERRDMFEAQLELAEQSSRKLYTKWRKTSRKVAKAYFDAVVAGGIPGRIYAETYKGRADTYYDLEVLAAAKAVNLYREEHQIGDDYKVTIAIDGLPKNLRPKIGRGFRLLGIKIRNVHGERDEASPIIRLADAVAGVVRDAREGKAECIALQQELQKGKILYKL